MAQAFKVVDQVIGFQGIHETSTTQNHPLGTRCIARDANDGPAEFIYLSGKNNTVQGTWIYYDLDNYSTALLVADVIGPVAVAMSANVANQYGWYGIYGKIEAQMAASFADDGHVYFASTGVCDDTISAGNRVQNARGAETIVGAGLAEVQLWYPFVNDGLAD